MSLKDIRTLTKEELSLLLQELGAPSFRSKQVWEWLWQKHADSFQAMHNLPLALRGELQERLSLVRPTIEHVQKSDDGTIKCGFRFADGELVEGVLIPHKDRLTACISSQVGCSLACSFCATAALPRKRNLLAHEILDQVIGLNKFSLADYNRPLSNIVYMGMGEPLLNYNEVLRSASLITTPDGLGMSPRRLTLSTAGVAKMITRLGDDGVKFNLALSLHSAINEKRSQVMGINNSSDVEALEEAVIYFTECTGNMVTLEYVLLAGFNDGQEDADALARFASATRSKVNLIEYNPVDTSPFLSSSGNRIYLFKEWLEGQGVIANIRRSRGKDIDAACGQLAGKNKVV